MIWKSFSLNIFILYILPILLPNLSWRIYPNPNKNRGILNNKTFILCFSFHQNLLKKIKFVLITSFTILLMCTPLNPSYEEFIFHCVFYLRALIFICKNPFLFFLFMITCENLSELFSSVKPLLKIYLSPNLLPFFFYMYIFLSVRIHSYQWSSVKIFSNLFT